MLPQFSGKRQEGTRPSQSRDQLQARFGGRRRLRPLLEQLAWQGETLAKCQGPPTGPFARLFEAHLQLFLSPGPLKR
jgi:hypothetical protein